MYTPRVKYSMNFFRSSHRLFITMIVIKGIEWVFQLSIWFLTLFLSRQALYNLVGPYLEEELLQQNHVVITQFLMQTLQWLTISTQHFIAFYFLSHGVIKFFIVYNVLRKNYWVYPFAIFVFSFFTFYQIYLYLHSHSLWMIGLVIIDIIVSWLTYIEYENMKAKHLKSLSPQ